MSEKSFAFIICSNNETYLNECITYINNLNIPDEYDLDILSISGAASMAAGYNEGMNASDAKYKIYLHQDVFILNKNFLYELLNIFSDPAIGIVGPVGCSVKISDADYTKSGENTYANTYVHTGFNTTHFNQGFKADNSLIDAYMLDGMLLATQYDIPWDEENMTGWDFYDTSQCTRFLNEGYRCVIANSATTWSIHDEGICNLSHYDHYREVFCKVYQCNNYSFVPNSNNRARIYANIKKNVDDFMAIIPQMSPTNVLYKTNEFLEHNVSDSRIYCLYNLFKLFNIESNSHIPSPFYPNGDLGNSFELYQQLKFLLWRVHYGHMDEAQHMLDSFMTQGFLSHEVLDEIKHQVIC